MTPDEFRQFIERRNEREAAQLADPNVPKLPCGECGKMVILRGRNPEKTVGVICQGCTMAML